MVRASPRPCASIEPNARKKIQRTNKDRRSPAKNAKNASAKTPPSSRKATNTVLIAITISCLRPRRPSPRCRLRVMMRGWITGTPPSFSVTRRRYLVGDVLMCVGCSRMTGCICRRRNPSSISEIFRIGWVRLLCVCICAWGITIRRLYPSLAFLEILI